MIAVPPAVWGLCGVGLATLSLLPYFIATVKGTNRPHIFTWIIWSLLTGQAFAVQYAGGAGPGGWATGATFFFCVLILLVSVRNGEKTKTRADWACFLLALLGIPVWLATDSLSMAAVWVVVIDGLAYIPTMRKAWNRPWEEMVFTHVTANIKHVASLLGMTAYSMATAFYPVALMSFNMALVLLIAGRRLALRRAL